jgi:hypothetical protein
MLTIFSVPKAFLGHIGVIQRNALVSWMRLGEEVQVILLGNDRLCEAGSCPCKIFRCG